MIRILRNGQLLTAAFLDVSAISRCCGERGLLGLAFHPDYAANGRFFINYINNSGNTVIAGYTVSSNPDLADTTAQVVLSFSQPFSNHKAGWMGFGPDGYLYIASGDGGWSDAAIPDPLNNAQDITSNLLGKVLRIDVDADDFPADLNRNYAVPPGNPFVGIEGDDEIWSYGLRNPWRCAFDAETGDLYITDVGHYDWEEINFQSASSPGGSNYGWKCTEGLHCTTYGGCTCPSPSLTPPIHEYGHSGNPPTGCSITGGEVYRGCAIPELIGKYFYADFCSDEIWSFRYNGAVTDLLEHTVDFDSPDYDIVSISSFGKDAAGELYICDLSPNVPNAGEVFKIIPGDPIAITSSDPPAGAIDARRPFDPADGIPEGWQEVMMTFSGPVTCLTPLDFNVTQQGIVVLPPFVTEVLPINPNEVRLLLNRPLTLCAWTTIQHPSSGTSVRIGFLPGDVNGNGASDAADGDALLAFFNGIGPALPIWSTDINRSAATTPADILEEIDLLNSGSDCAILP